MVTCKAVRNKLQCSSGERCTGSILAVLKSLGLQKPSAVERMLCDLLPLVSHCDWGWRAWVGRRVGGVKLLAVWVGGQDVMWLQVVLVKVTLWY